MAALSQAELEAFKNGRFADFHKAIDGTDVEKIVSFYDPNAAVVFKDVSIVRGQDGVRIETQKFLDSCGGNKNTFTNMRLRGVDDYIILDTDYKLLGNNGTTTTGHFTQIWRKVNGAYVVYHDEFSVDK